MSYNPTRITPKGTLVFKNVDKDLNLADKSASGLVTIKKKFDHTTLGVSFTDTTARDVTSLKHVTASVEHRFGPKVAVGGNFSFDDKTWSANASWEGKVSHKKLTLKSVYAAKTGKFTTEANLIVRPHQKATVVLNKLNAETAKYSITQGAITYEPSYNFAKNGFSLAATKKIGGNQTYKISYDFKSEVGGFEWNKRPYKIALSAPVSHQKLGKATVALTWEHEFHV